VEQIVSVLKQAEVGVPAAELIRKVGISVQTFYRWKTKYAGLEVDQVRPMKQLREETTRLKHLVADWRWIRPCCGMCCEKSCKALAAPFDGQVPATGLSGERTARMLRSGSGTTRESAIASA
jgi:putative transposase